jgi:hypothetical protein
MYEYAVLAVLAESALWWKYPALYVLYRSIGMVCNVPGAAELRTTVYVQYG